MILGGVKSAARVLLVMAGAILIGIAPAVAIETSRFGIDVAERTTDGRLHIRIEAGERSTGKVRVWNKTTEPMRLRLSIVPATVDEDRSVKLGGDDEPVGWTSVKPGTVELPPGGDATAEVAVQAPRRLDGDTKTVAVVAEPAAAPGEAPAVLQRLAVTTYLEPDEDSLIASLGPFPWIAGVVLIAVVVALVLRARRREPTATSD